MRHKEANNKEGKEYKHFLVDILRQVASAYGSTRLSLFDRGNVSDKEQQFLDHISYILNV